MDFDAEKYNKTNKLQIRDAKELLAKIVAENCDKKYDIILDIGCGTGNVTQLLAKTLTTNQIYAIDVDEEMVGFAKQNHSSNQITYIAQDFGVDWEQLAPELQALDGKVSLIFSNHCLHWIRDKENVAKNLNRLLTKSGRIYANIYWISDPYIGLAPDEKTVHEREFMAIPPKETQLQNWLDLFGSVGLTVDLNEFYLKTCIFDRNIFVENLLPLSWSIRKIYFAENELKDPESKREQLFSKILSNVRHFSDETTGEAMVEFRYGFFRFVLHK